MPQKLFNSLTRSWTWYLFTPTTGGVGPVASSFLIRLGLLISEKSQLPYSSTLNLLRCKLSFSILKSSIRCIRGSRSSSSRPIATFPNDFDREISECLLN